MLKNNKVKLFGLSLLTASLIGTSGCGLTKGEIVSRAAQGAINASAAYLTQITPRDELQIGQQMIRQVASEFKEYTANPQLVSYVRSVGAQVVNQAARRNELNYQFYVLDSPIVNAFTIPGGAVFITTEALKYIKNEAELAGVLAHEVGHNENKHTVSTIRRAMAAQGLAQGALREGDSALIQLVAGLTLNLILNGFSRAQEKEADETGTLIATKLNYNPLALSGFLSTLSGLSGGDSSRLIQLFQTHPGSQERINNINNFISKNNIRVNTPVTNEDRYRSVISVLGPKVDLKNARPQ